AKAYNALYNSWYSFDDSYVKQLDIKNNDNEVNKEQTSEQSDIPPTPSIQSQQSSQQSSQQLIPECPEVQNSNAYVLFYTRRGQSDWNKESIFEAVNEGMQRWKVKEKEIQQEMKQDQNKEEQIKEKEQKETNLDLDWSCKDASVEQGLLRQIRDLSNLKLSGDNDLMSGNNPLLAMIMQQYLMGQGGNNSGY
ncbi:MAG: hypothetical protein EZS28_023886, partial [Streblomastix strix]